MARGINKVILIGNLGQDPESRTTPGGTTVTNIRIATSESWRDKQSGEMKEQTEWHTVVMWNRLGEIAAEYLRKGSQVYIEGRLQTRKWQDKSGNDRYSTEVVASEMQMLGGRGGGAPSESRDRRDTGDDEFAPPARGGGGGGGYSRGGGGGGNAGGGAGGGSSGGGGGGADFDDDIPF